ncbi:cAMP-specific 3',5'-cyclic phosphodiesterase 4D [Chytridiales sp. JEL 0842]|nr:cAMP-specific 3',5'-cyclic phosphodiesterase 4D [Chytridiales sp. JEL 0842]
MSTLMLASKALPTPSPSISSSSTRPTPSSSRTLSITLPTRTILLLRLISPPLIPPSSPPSTTTATATTNKTAASSPPPLQPPLPPKPNASHLLKRALIRLLAVGRLYLCIWLLSGGGLSKPASPSRALLSTSKSWIRSSGSSHIFTFAAAEAVIAGSPSAQQQKPLRGRSGRLQLHRDRNVDGTAVTPPSSNIEPTTDQQRLQVESKLTVGNVTFPNRINYRNLPLVSLFMSVPSTNTYWAALVSTMKMALDDFQNGEGLMPDVFVDMRVALAQDRKTLFTDVFNGTTTGGVVGFIGHDTITGDETTSIATSFNIPLCDPFDNRDEFTDRFRNPTYFRSIPSESDSGAAVFQFLKQMGWTQVAMISSLTLSGENLLNVATANNLKIVGSFKVGINNISPTKQIWDCSDALKQIKTLNTAVIIFNGDFQNYQTCRQAAISLQMVARNGYTWIIDTSSPQSLDVNLLTNGGETNEGIFAMSLREGQGPEYENFLAKWRRPDTKNRYPYIEMYNTPPKGFMFFRTCIQLMLKGYDRLLFTTPNPTQVNAGDLAKGYLSNTLNAVKVPETFAFPELNTVTGKVNFNNGTANRIGHYDWLYCTRDVCQNVGMIPENKVLTINSTILAELGWTFAADQISTESASSLALKVVFGVIGSFVVIFGAILFYALVRRLKKKSQELEKIEEELQRRTNNSEQAGPRYDLDGPGQRALELLRTLRDTQERKKIKASDIDFLIEVFVSGNSYLPNLNENDREGGVGLDDEMRNFLMGNVLGVMQSPANGGQSGSSPSGPLTSMLDDSSDRGGPQEVRRNSTGLNFKTSLQTMTKGGVGSQIHGADSEVAIDNRQGDIARKGTKTSNSNKQPSNQYRYQSHQELFRPVELSLVDVRSLNDYLDLWYHSWNFDMFEFSEMAGGHPLYFTGIWLADQSDLLSSFKIEKEKFHAWLLMMESEYRPHPYHNAIHAADVLHAFNFLLLEASGINEKYSAIEKLSSIIAAIGHDIDHPGFTNQYMVKTRHPMAIMYSDVSVNEYHHSAHVFQLSHSSPHNIFGSLNNEEYEEVRRIIIRLILATDMGKHFEYLTKFKAKVSTNGFNRLETQENRLIVMEIALKCGDLNNPSKTPALAGKWCNSIMEEFYRQGDSEKELGVPISQFMDRSNANVAKCQIGFIDILVAPLFDAWVNFMQGDERCSKLQKAITKNRSKWAGLSVSQQLLNNLLSQQPRDPTQSFAPGESGLSVYQPTTHNRNSSVSKSSFDRSQKSIERCASTDPDNSGLGLNLNLSLSGMQLPPLPNKETADGKIFVARGE